MKPTVDLTEDRIFHDVRNSRYPEWLWIEDKWNDINKWFNHHLNRIPWETESIKVVTCDEDLFVAGDPIAGSAAKYREDEEVAKAVSCEYCDRCGKPIRLPWSYRRELCDDCTKALRREVAGSRSRDLPWENWSNFSSIFQNSDIAQ